MSLQSLISFFCLFLCSLSLVSATIVTFGGIPNDSSLSTCWSNTALLNQTFASLQPGDTFILPNAIYYVMGGIYASQLYNVTLQFDGTLKFSDDEKAWPRDQDGKVFECMYFEQLSYVTFTSSNRGIIDGSGEKWWGFVQYLLIGENRPRLISIYNSSNLLVENLLLKNSPYWTFLANDVANVEIRYTDVDARRDNATYHDLTDLQAFNTDGFDVAGRDVWIHDCNIWNDDDCIAVKQVPSSAFHAKCSENMLFERINASGVGLTIGSIGPSAQHTCVRNITFRDCVMPNTFKGLYLKSRPGHGTASITDIIYENIDIYNPTQWAIWIGPQQAVYKEACSLLWPDIPGAECPSPAEMTWKNILFRNITIHSPQTSPGVILGNTTNPMLNIVFDGVRVLNPGKYPWGDKFYACDGVQGIATGGTQPVPPCFNTTAVLY